MIYEATISYVGINDKGSEVTIKDSYILQDKESFSDVEETLYSEFGQMYSDFDVQAIKRSRIKEVANSRVNDDKIYLATISDTFVDDNSNEKEIKYIVALFAKDFDNAKAFISEYLKQGYGMQLKSLKETKFIDVI